MFDDRTQEEQLPINAGDHLAAEGSSSIEHDKWGARNGTIGQPATSKYRWSNDPASSSFSDGDTSPDSSVISRLRRATEDFVRANVGLLLIIASQWFFALMNLGVKYLVGLDQPVPTFELVGIRMAVTCVCCVAWMYWQEVEYPVLGPPEVRHLLALRGVTGFFGLFGLYYSLGYLSLSDATAITFLVPSTIMIAGWLVLGEPLALRQVIAGLFALFGVLLIARPEAVFGPATDSDSSTEKGTPAERLVAVGVALLGVLGATGAMITIRHIGSRSHPMHSISYFSAWCVIVSVAGSGILHVPWVLPTNPMWALGLFGIGLAGFVAQVLLTMGLQRERAGRGSMGLYSQIVYSTILDRIFFHARPPILSIIGTLIITSSAIYVALTKQPSEKTNPSGATSPTVLSRTSTIEPMLPITNGPSRNQPRRTDFGSLRRLLPFGSSGRWPSHRSSPSGGATGYTALDTVGEEEMEE